MWFSVPLSLPPNDGARAVGRLVRWHAAIGTRLAPGDALADVRIDFSAGVTRDCPPVTTCRIILRETAWLRDLAIAPGIDVAGGTDIARLSAEATSPRQPPARRARMTIVAIIDHQDWWAAAP